MHFQDFKLLKEEFNDKFNDDDCNNDYNEKKPDVVEELQELKVIFTVVKLNYEDILRKLSFLVIA